MNVFVVYKVGVYRHETVGVFDNRDSASSAAIMAAAHEFDTYHKFEVWRYLMGHIDSKWGLQKKNSYEHLAEDSGTLILTCRKDDQ